MANSNRRTVPERIKKRLRGVAMRYPYLVGAATFVSGLLLDSAADYYLSDLWERISEIVKSFMG